MSVILCVYFFLFSLCASSFHFYMMTRLERSSKWHKLRTGRINFMGIYIPAADVTSQHVHYFLQCVQQKWKNSAIKNLCRYLNKWLYTRLVNSLFPMLNIINNMNILKRIADIFLIIVGFSMLIKNSRHTTYSALVIYQLKTKLKSSMKFFGLLLFHYMTLSCKRKNTSNEQLPMFIESNTSSGNVLTHT